MALGYAQESQILYLQIYIRRSLEALIQEIILVNGVDHIVQSGNLETNHSKKYVHQVSYEELRPVEKDHSEGCFDSLMGHFWSTYDG